MSTRRARSIVVGTLAAAVVLLGACGGDDDGAVPPEGGDVVADAPTDGADVDAAPETDGDSTTDDGDLGPIALGLRASLQADRVEVEGNTIHIYVRKSDRIVAGAGSECIVASRVVPEGTTVVIHRDGVESTC